MRTNQNIVTRVILAAVTAGTLASGVAVPLMAATAPATASAGIISPDLMPHG
jgi:hypothetical protein